MNTELLQMATQICRKENIPQVTHDDDDIGPVIPELSRFLRDETDVKKDSPVIQFLAASGKEVIIAANGDEDTRWVLNGQGVCRMTKGKTELVSFREAIQAFCGFPVRYSSAREGMQKTQPEDLLPFLTQEVERLAEEVVTLRIE